MQKIYPIMFVVSIGLTIVALAALLMFGLNLGVDFKGGSILEISFSGERPAVDNIQGLLKSKFPDKDISIYASGNDGFILRTGELLEKEHQDIFNSVKKEYSKTTVTEKRFDSVGPIIGQELKQKSVKALILTLLAIVVYIAFVFRKMSTALSSWAMSIAAMLALAHDVLIPIGVFSLLGHFYGVEISAVFVAAILTILGYSVSDTVVVFDRVRENVIRNRSKENFGEIVHKSIMQTLTRSLNTNLTVLLSLVSIYLFGGESLKYFSLALIIGIFLGAYSSIFVASPLLVWWSVWTRKNR